jgi:DNA-binding SARP family transcriptional activator
MEFRILGPLEVAEHGSRLEVGRGKERSVLAILLLHANEVISSERLIDDLWGDEPPATAAKSVQVYVSRLRKALASAGSGASPDGVLLPAAAATRFAWSRVSSMPRASSRG